MTVSGLTAMSDEISRSPADPHEGEPPLLRLRGVSRHFGPVQALSGVDIDLHAGEILALVGQNGAGKSTLGKLIGGFDRPDEGTIAVAGKDLSAMDWRERAAAVATVAQELSIVPTSSVAENVFLGSRRRGVWRSSALARDARGPLERVGLGGLDPRQPASGLSVAEAQLLEIARAIAREARIVIFDEPTASLSDTEIQRVEGVVRRLAREGRGVVYVTHRLGEIVSFCDRALVLRNGVPVARREMSSTSVQDLVRDMLGRAPASLFPPRRGRPGGVVLSVRGVQGPGLVGPATVELRAGEITAFAGQLGGGASALLRLLGGFERSTAGSVMLDGVSMPSGSVDAAVDRGILSCSDDRKRDGFFTSRSVTENLTALSLGAVSRGPWLMGSRERAFASRAAEFLGLDQSRLRSPVNVLSGGNQQKVVLGKLACREPPPRVLLLDEPTRGVDVGARSEIYTLVRGLADRGVAVGFVSSDVTEVVGLADQAVTFFRGRQVSTLSGGHLDEAAVTLDVTHSQERSHG